MNQEIQRHGKVNISVSQIAGDKSLRAFPGLIQARPDSKMGVQLLSSHLALLFHEITTPKLTTTGMEWL
jgi:hypothetical protein